MDLPKGKQVDEFGGFTLSIDQSWFGHRARKRTWLYVCGIKPAEIPAMPLKFDAITHVVSSVKKGHRAYKPSITHAEREHTPLELAKWLVELAALTSK